MARQSESGLDNFKIWRPILTEYVITYALNFIWDAYYRQIK